MTLAEVEAKMKADNDLQMLLGGTELVRNSRFVLKHLDTSGDGDSKVSRSEFARRLLPLIEGANSSRPPISAQRKTKKAATPQGKLEELFEDIDTDGSGQARALWTCSTASPCASQEGATDCRLARITGVYH